MERKALLSPLLLAVALFPAHLQGGPGCGPNGDASLVSLELEAGGLNRVVGFDPAEREYNVWFDVPSTVTLRAQTTDPGSSLRENSSGDLVPFGNVGGGEGVLTIPSGLTEIWVVVFAPGGASFSYVLHINPACSGGDCDDANSCTSDACNTGNSTCEFTDLSDGTSCDGGTGSCQSGTCIDNCDGVDCSDGDECTQDVCDSAAGGTCSNPPGPAGILCDAGTGPNTGQCDGLGACPVIDPLCLQAVGGTVPTACRNAFNQQVATVPLDMTVALDRCVHAGQPFNATVTPTMAIDQAFLNFIAQTLCYIAIPLEEIQVDTAQVRVDALAGATCTSALSELSPVPQTVLLDVTVSGVCGAGGTVTVNSTPLIPLPPVSLSCIAGAPLGPVAFCADGTTPDTVLGGDPAVDTYTVISVSPFVVGSACSPGVSSADNMSVDPIDPAVDCIIFPIACNPGDCDDANSCTSDVCNTGNSTCEFTDLPDGTSCNDGTGSCQSGTCIDSCQGVDCSDGNVCTEDVCDSAAGGTCSNPPGPAGVLCDAGTGPSSGQCDGLGSCPVIDPLCLQAVSGTVPTACRNSFNQEVATVPLDMTIALDRCVHAGQPFSATVTPTMMLNQSDLNSIAQVFCGSGILVDEIRVDTAQVRIDAFAGATCTSALSEFSPVPQIIPLDITVIGGGCGGGGGVTVNSAVSIPLPPVLVSCTAGAAPGPVAFCADGATPDTVLGGDPAVDTYTEIVAGQFLIDFACSPGVSSPDNMSVDPIDPAVDCITFAIAPN